jgi:DNA-binding beta-propeller fold protein YncE
MRQRLELSMMNATTRGLFALALLGSSIAAAQTEPAHFHVARRIPVEGDGSFDLLAVDAASGRLFLSHGTLVQVVDTKAGKLVGTIPDTQGVHGIALAPDLGKGFITCGKSNSVAIFDLKTLDVQARLPVTGTNPDAILYEPESKRAFAFSGRSSNATVIDAATSAVIGTVALDGKPELAACDGAGLVFVNLEDKNEVVSVDGRTLKVGTPWALAPGEEPTGLAIDVMTHRLFVGCHNKLMVVLDAQSGKLVTTLPIGERVDGVGFDPGTKCAYSSNGDGTLTVIEERDADTFRVLENVVTQSGAKTLAVDPVTHHVYLPTAEPGETPKATPENPRPRPAMKPGSFVVLDVEPVAPAPSDAIKPAR